MFIIDILLCGELKQCKLTNSAASLALQIRVYDRMMEADRAERCGAAGR